ncbi:type II secretion system F family protein [Actinotalea solisilvae]|uniref:type II secretion system F family protein n=1 Tax=Actinotalea solisilvae TaxID=2072922 RepID=UPI001F387C28|nr:type II secretion system F family protein [Actinotalea solisilvae]
MDLLSAACAAGASLPAALIAVGAAVPPSSGRALARAGTALRLGSTWDEAWPDGGPVARALRPGWEDGSAPGPALRAAADAVRRDRHARALEAASRLGVRLVVPLGLCHLPAFVLVGVAPVLVSMAGGGLSG